MDDDNVSEFGCAPLSDDGPINFSQARRLERSGSTCDAYIARYHNKTVFVKRLKAELKNSPRERTAFAKEFELGISLLHPALPVYRDIHDDYIVMDYVDGTTLAEMIVDHDQWLMNPENIRTLLQRLVDVVGYLHSKNVLHSDIKPDNVMVTRGTRNIMLIDLDKAYTYTHNDTAGAPSKYGLGEGDRGNPAIDYNGIALIVDRLTAAGFPTKRFRRFRNLCTNPDVRTEELLQVLENKPTSLWRYWFGGLIALILIGGYLWFVNSEKSGARNRDGEMTQSADTVVRTDTVLMAPASEPASHTSHASNEQPSDKGAEYFLEELPDDVQISNSARAKIVATQEVTRVVDALYCHLDDLSKMRKDTTLSSAELLSAMRDFTAREDRYFEGIKRIILTEQPDISAYELYILVYNSPKALDYIKQSNLVQEKVSAEFRRRYIKEHGEAPPPVIP